MENVGNYRNCATRIILEILVHITSGFLLSGHPPSRLGCFPSILHRWKWSLVWIQGRDRKSTRLNSSHTVISYAVFCLKKKNKSTPDEAPEILVTMAKNIAVRVAR